MSTPVPMPLGVPMREAPAAVSAYRWYALTVLILVYACHYLDRTVVSVVLEAVRHEFSLNDRQLGVLSGLAYGLSFAIAGIPLGALIDRVNRKRLLSTILLIWSGLTALSGTAQSYAALLLARVGVGAAEAGGSPTSMTLISDLFPAKQRATAMGLFFLSAPIGFCASFALGGWIVAEYGWRTAFFAAGAPGIFLALLILVTFREPQRGAFDVETPAGAAPGYLDTLRFVRHQRSLVWLTLAMILAASVQASFVSWVAPFFIRMHGTDVKEAGVYIALAIGLFGGIGTPLAGWLADRIGRRDPRHMLWFVALVTVSVVPLGLVMLLSPAKLVAVALLMLMCMLMPVWLGASYGLALSLCPAAMRGKTTAVVQVLNNLIGFGVAPFVVGVLSDWYGGADSLRWALATVLLLGVFAALLYLLAARTLRADLQRVSI